MNKLDETIVAIATPQGSGAIGVIRISGPLSSDILLKLWKKNPKTPPTPPIPRHVYCGELHDPQTGVLLDQALFFFLQGPASYTGEDTVEIQAHGSRVLLEAFIKSILGLGARLARPGEFTERAFLNGRMDLAQAEAVADLISANSEQAVMMAHRQMEGKLSEYVEILRNDLRVMRAQMEAMIDFPEDEDIQELRIGYHQEIANRIKIISEKIKKLIQTYEEGRILREGIRVAFLGRPNVGKSSLFNALLSQDRAIVHDSAGTTRDLIEEVIFLENLPIRFIDTAGLRRGGERVESEGIRRTLERAQQVDLVLAVFCNGDSGDNGKKEDMEVIEAIHQLPSHITIFCLYNKSDLGQTNHYAESFLTKKISSFDVSAKTGAGLNDLKKAIVQHFVRKPNNSEVVLSNLRHRVSLEKGLRVLEEVEQDALSQKGLELLVIDLSRAMDFLGEVTGEITNDEILGEIFSRFCIGK